MGDCTGSADPILGTQFVIRKGTMNDLDAITRVVQLGFPDDPEFNYRFPYRLEYPEDHWKWTRREFEGYLCQSEKYVVLVAATSDTYDKPIAVSVWDIAVETKPTGGDNGIHERRDANPVHMEVWARILTQGFDHYFAAYGKQQIHLWLLTTHPDFRRQGAGTRLCNWGLEEARKKGWMLTVIASAMGKSLYEHLGYKLVGTLKIQANGEDETFDEYCLEKKPSASTV